MAIPLGFFAPLPVFVNVPLMAAQYAVMGNAMMLQMAWAKRHIKSLSNEDFNKLTPEGLFKKTLQLYQDSHGSLKKAIGEQKELQSFVIKELIDTIPKVIGDIFTGSGGGDITKSPYLTTATSNPYGVTDIRYDSGDLHSGTAKDKVAADIAALTKALEEAYAFAASIPEKKEDKPKKIDYSDIYEKVKDFTGVIPPATKFKDLTDTKGKVVKYGGKAVAQAQFNQLFSDLALMKKQLSGFIFTEQSYAQLKKKGFLNPATSIAWKKVKNQLLDLQKKIKNNQILMNNPMYQGMKFTGA